MKIQNRQTTQGRNKKNPKRIYTLGSSLSSQLEIKEFYAYQNENYWEAFIVQFSFIERIIDSINRDFANKFKLNKESLVKIKNENSVSNKITLLDCLTHNIVSNDSKQQHSILIEKLYSYNNFRNDLLHNCSKTKCFQSATQIDQAVMEAYDEGKKIFMLIDTIKLTNVL